MKIQSIISQHRNDFSAILVCEHCGHTQKLTTGYDDSYYHKHVIPAMRCLNKECDKNRAGTPMESK